MAEMLQLPDPSTDRQIALQNHQLDMWKEQAVKEREEREKDPQGDGIDAGHRSASRVPKYTIVVRATLTPIHANWYQ